MCVPVSGVVGGMIDDVVGFTEQFVEAFYKANPLLRPEPADTTKPKGLTHDALD